MPRFPAFILAFFLYISGDGGCCLVVHAFSVVAVPAVQAFAHRSASSFFSSKKTEIVRSSFSNRSTMMAKTEDDSSSSSASLMGIPTVEQLARDPFLKQVQYAEFMVGLLEEDAGRQTDVVMRRLRAQLSHADGIRGFMVTYLTQPPHDKNVNEPSSSSSKIPPALLQAILEVVDPVDDRNEMINLMCLNVIMPTAMVTLHKDPELSMQSAWTAARALNLLTQVLDASGRDSPLRQAVTQQCNAILKMASRGEVLKVEGGDDGGGGGGSSDALELYWSKVFDQWGYKEAQLSDIANAVRMVLSQ